MAALDWGAGQGAGPCSGYQGIGCVFAFFQASAWGFAAAGGLVSHYSARMYAPEYVSDDMGKAICGLLELKREDLFLPQKKDSIRRLREWHAGHSEREHIALDLWEYDKLFPFGASATDLDTPGVGVIHLSQYLRGVRPEDSPFLELFWNTQEVPPLYAYYRDYLRAWLGRGKGIG